MEVKYLGHSCLQFDIEGTLVLTDPFVQYNELAKDIQLSNIKADYIFLSHGHEDHVADMATVQKNNNATVAAIVETAAWVRKQGVPNEKVVEFNLGGTLSLPFGTVKMVYALHTNSTPDGVYGGNPVGFIFKTGNKTIYFAGDTALTVEMSLLAHLNIDIAFLPIGGHYTMDVDDAVLAADLINCKRIVGIHYDTFPPIVINKKEAIEKFKQAGLMLELPEVGDSIVI